MTWSKDFTAVTLRGEDTLNVEGDSSAADDIDDADVEQLYVVISAAPDSELAMALPVVTDEKSLVSPWAVTFEDVPWPLCEPGRCLQLTGIGLVRGEPLPFAWTQRKKVRGDKDPKPKPGSDC